MQPITTNQPLTEQDATLREILTKLNMISDENKSISLMLRRS